jgi:translocation and assembly module TamB
VNEVAPKKRRWWRFLLWFLAGVAVGFAGLAWYASTDSFQAMVRRRMVAELERVTGGRVELAEFHTIPFRLRADIRNLTIHGRESASETPYVHLDRLVADINVISVFDLRFGFHSVVLERPVIHIIVYPDGTTNQPQPAVKSTSDQTPVEQLFGLRIRHLEVQKGELIWNDQRMPLDFSANDVVSTMNYSFLRRHYEAELTLGKVDTKIQDYRPFSWRVHALFTLARENVEVKELKINSGANQVTFQGALTNFRAPLVKGKYSATLDLTEVAGILRQRELRRGLVDFQGSGQWSLQDFSAEGKLAARELEWRDDGVNLQNVSVATAFDVKPQRITLKGIESRILGGTVSGEADVIGWQRTLRGEPRVQRRRRELSRAEEEAMPRGSVRLRMSGLPLTELKRAFRTRSLPLERARFAGFLSGTTDIFWIGVPRDAETRFAVKVTPPDRLTGPDIPLTLNARGVYRGSRDELEIHDVSMATPATRVTAEGTLSSTASVKFSVSTTDLRELEPLLAGPNSKPLPIALKGRATFSGNASGRVHDIHLAGNLQITDFDSIAPATADRSELRVHWDSATAVLQYTKAGVVARNALLVHGDTQIRFDVNAGLQRGSFSENSPITGHIDVRQGNIAEILSLAGYSYPVDGQMNLTAKFSGSVRTPAGDGHVEIDNATAYGESISKLVSDIRFANGEAQLTNFSARQGNAVVTGDAAYQLSSKTYRINLVGKDFDLARIERIQKERFTVAGRLDFTAQGTGTFDVPVVKADLHLRSLTLNDERVGAFDLQATTQGSQLTLNGTSNFQDAKLQIGGTVTMRDDYPADLKLEFTQLDVDPLLRIYLRGQVTGHSSMAGNITLRGPLRKPRELVLAANFTRFSADVDKIQVQNEGPVKIGFANQTLQLEQMHLIGLGTDLTAHGTAQFSGNRALDLRADGTINMTLAQTWVPDLTSSGTITVGLNVTGTPSSPVFRGQVKIADGALSYIDLPTGLSELNGSLTFNENQLQVESLTARTGGGTLNVTGAISYYQRQIIFDLKGTAQEVRLRYPPGISSTTNADVRLTGTNNGATLSGDLTVMKLAMTPGFDFGSYLERAKLSAPVPQASSPMNRLKLDLHVMTTPELQMQTAMAKLSGDADLRVRGSAARPVVLGRIDILEGEVSFNGAKYRLERGDVLFTNPARIEPILDLEASTRVSDYDVSIGVNGTADKLNVNYRSEPPLPSADIIALLALGRTREESASLQGSTGSSLSSAASNLILSEALNATVSSRVQRLFGVSRIKIDPQGLPSATNVVRGPQVTIEQQVASNVTLTYSTNVAVASQQIIQLEYNVTRAVSIVALRDQNGVVSFDIKIRKRRK